MQANFFEQPKAQNQTGDIITSSNRPKKRVFLYGGKVFEDPGPEYSIQDIMGFLAETYPELTSGTWSSRALPDGSEEITFVKVTGEKGGQQ